MSIKKKQQTLVATTVNGYKLNALIDSCSTDDFIKEAIMNRLKLNACQTIKMILTLMCLNTNNSGILTVLLEVNGPTYPSTTLRVF